MKLPKLKIGKFTAEIPIIQGGMGVGISLHSLSSAVANEGAIGVISSAGIGWEEKDVDTNYIEANNRALIREIQKAKQLTKGLIGINIMVALGNFPDLCRAASKYADIILSGAGLPLSLPEYVKGSDIAIVPIVSSKRAVAIICKTWARRYSRIPDAIAVEGPLAGGHLGFSMKELIEKDEHPLEKIVVDVIDTVKPFEDKYGKKIPVIAAGGIWDGKDIAKFIKLGASGVKISTCLVCTYECDASPAFKQTYLDSKKDDIILIKSPVGMPGRAIRNKFLEAVERGEKMPFHCPYQCIKTCVPSESPYCIALALINAKQGKFDGGFAFAGANAYRCDKIISVKELIQGLIKEAESVE